MKYLLIFILSSSGLSWILCKSKIFKKFREGLTTKYMNIVKKLGSLTFSGKIKYKLIWFLHELFSCMGCMGFWSGIFCFNFIYRFSFNILILGFIGSISSLLMDGILNFLNKR